MIKIFLSALLAGTIAAAEQTGAPPTPVGDSPSIQAYGDIDTACQQWSDACRACGRGSDGAPVCSNIGIACQPKLVQCTTRKEDPVR